LQVVLQAFVGRLFPLTDRGAFIRSQPYHLR
jgi:hypothetical protein